MDTRTRLSAASPHEEHAQSLTRDLLRHHLNALNGIGDQIRFALNHMPTDPPQIADSGHFKALFAMRQRCAQIVQALAWDRDGFEAMLWEHVHTHRFRANGADHAGPVIVLCALYGHTNAARTYWQQLPQHIRTLVIRTIGDGVQTWMEQTP